MTPTHIRDAFIASLGHIEVVRGKLNVMSGRGQPLTFPDHHKLAEGLLLSAWTHWEEFLRDLFISDLASSPSAALLREVKQFRTKGASARLAEAIVGHPDERGWVEWNDFDRVAERADSLIGIANRFRLAVTPTAGGVVPLNRNDLQLIKRVRNAIAHKSDHAWSSFRLLTLDAPFSLTKRQMKGITVGRFLVAHNWSGPRVLQQTIAILRVNAGTLVP